MFSKSYKILVDKMFVFLFQEKRDSCVVMATGYCKSLCYQYPPVFCNGLAIIISPLIALMQDQVLNLQVSSTVVKLPAITIYVIMYL